MNRLTSQIRAATPARLRSTRRARMREIGQTHKTPRAGYRTQNSTAPSQIRFILQAQRARIKLEGRQKAHI